MAAGLLHHAFFTPVAAPPPSCEWYVFWTANIILWCTVIMNYDSIWLWIKNWVYIYLQECCVLCPQWTVAVSYRDLPSVTWRKWLPHIWTFPISRCRVGYKNLCVFWLQDLTWWFIYNNTITVPPPPTANSHSLPPAVLCWFLVDHTWSSNDDINAEDLAIMSPTFHLMQWDLWMINQLKMIFLSLDKKEACAAQGCSGSLMDLKGRLWSCAALREHTFY